MNEAERTIVSISFVRGFRAAFYDEHKNEIFYDDVDGFAVTKDAKGYREVEAFLVDEYKHREGLETGVWFPADVSNFIRLVRGSSNFLAIDDPAVIDHVQQKKKGSVSKTMRGAVPVAVPGSHKTWLQFDASSDQRVEAAKEWPPEARQVAKQAFDQAIREGKSRDDAISFAYEAGLLANKQLNTP